MLKYSPSVFAKELVPVPVDTTEVDVLEAVELVVLLEAVDLTEEAIVTTAVSRAGEDEERIDDDDAARLFPQLFFSYWCSPEPPPPPKAPGPARNSRGCKETTDEVLDVAVVFTLEDDAVELLVAEAVPGTHW